MPQKRSPELESPSANKLPKTDQSGREDFSSSVKKKLSTATRTGQACDRCKVRRTAYLNSSPQEYQGAKNSPGP